MENIYSNIFYFHNINSIGGVETFFYYLAKKYQEKDITVFYSSGNTEQVKRLKKLVRVKKYKEGEIIKCKRAFFNYDPKIIDNVIAEEYIQIIHADFKNQDNLEIKINPKITKYIGVSKQVCESFKELTGKEVELCYNPVEIDTPNRLIKLISATRLTTEKGKERMVKLGKLLNEAGIPYIWLIFTDDTDAIRNPNIAYMKPQLNIMTYINEADFLVQLSSSEAYCFSVVESLMLGKPVIVTDLPVYEELGLDESNSIKLDLDFNEIDIKKILKKYNFTFNPPKDNWEEVLINKKSNYKEELEMKYLVEALDIYEENGIEDGELGRVPKAGERWIISNDRLEVLLGENEHKRTFVKVIEEIKGDEVLEAHVNDDENTEVGVEIVEKKTTKKTTKKK